MQSITETQESTPKITLKCRFSKKIDLTGFTEQMADEWYNRGYQMSQNDDLEQAEEDPDYEYCSCLEEALCNVQFTYGWEEICFKRGYIAGC